MSTLWFHFIHEKNIITIKLLLFVTYAHVQEVMHTARVLRIAGGTISSAVCLFAWNCMPFKLPYNTSRYFRLSSASIFISLMLFGVLNPLKPELNPICYLLALLGAHHFLHVSRIRVKLLTLRRLMPYIYGAPILDVSRSHTTTQHSR